MKIDFNKAEFKISAINSNQYPSSHGEIAFIGRSNAGKSSCINALCNRKKLVKISKNPGKTRLINFFHLQDDRFLVDLPGYGFAKVNKQEKQLWAKIIENYLINRISLKSLILLIDIRVGLTNSDWHMVNWTITHNIKLRVVLTKADKVSFNKAKIQLTKNNHELNKLTCKDLISIQIFSATKKIELKFLQQYITENL